MKTQLEEVKSTNKSDLALFILERHKFKYQFAVNQIGLWYSKSNGLVTEVGGVTLEVFRYK